MGLGVDNINKASKRGALPKVRGSKLSLRLDALVSFAGRRLKLARVDQDIDLGPPIGSEICSALPR